jgi:hypothetical protein
VSEHWLSFVHRTLSREQYDKFQALWQAHEQPLGCSFVSAVIAEPGAPLSPIHPERAAAEVRDMALTARVLYRSKWWDTIPSQSVRGSRRYYSLEFNDHATEAGHELHGEIEVQP